MENFRHYLQILETNDLKKQLDRSIMQFRKLFPSTLPESRELFELIKINLNYLKIC